MHGVNKYFVYSIIIIAYRLKMALTDNVSVLSTFRMEEIKLVRAGHPGLPWVSQMKKIKDQLTLVGISMHMR